MDVLPVHDSPTECEEPDKEIVAGEFVALLATLTLPVALPVAVGANRTVRVAVWLGVRVKPDVTPLALNPAPDTFTPEMVTFEFPLFVSVTVSELLLPTATPPKFKLVGFAPSRKVAVWPVPARLIVSCAGEPFVTSAIDPLAAPVEVGAKTALKVTLPPAAIVVAVERPVTLKPAPVTFICEKVRVALPLFRSVTVWELLLPVATLPKLTLVGDAAICA